VRVQILWVRRFADGRVVIGSSIAAVIFSAVGCSLRSNGDPPQPLYPNTRLSGWICLENLEWAVHLLDARIVTVHQLYPIYVEEAELARTAGDQALAILFLERGIPHEISLNRASAVK
jgi:hypothetical protein